MKLFDLLNEVKIDNKSGIGEVPDNRNVDYLGLRVKMKPSVFLKLASPLPREQARSVDYIKQQLAHGQGIASPWLVIDIPVEWDNGSLEKPARVTAHEGRNRMYAVLEKEGDTPVETHLFFAGGLRARHIKPEWIEALNKSLVPQRRASPVPGPFFEMDKKLDERKGAPGTLKAKITRLYGGDVTCAKTQKLKTRKGATTLDKRQANWFQNKHCGGATRVDEIISGGSIPGDWKKYGSGDAEMFETEFDFQKHKITISVSRDWAQSGAYVLMKKNIEPKADLIGREIIFRVDGETDPTGLLGTGAAGVMSIVVGKIVGLLKTISWDYLVFAGAGDSRQRLYTKILERLAQGLDSEPMQFGDWFLLIKNHLLAAKSQKLAEVFKGGPLASKWEHILGGSNYYTEFEYAGSQVQIQIVQDNDYDLETILGRKVPENWTGYEIAFSVDDSITVTGAFDQESVRLFDLIIRKLKGFFLIHPWDYINFSGEAGSRNRLYLRLAKQLAPSDSTVLHRNKSFAIVKKNKLKTLELDESYQPIEAAWKQDKVGASPRYSTAFEFGSHLVRISLTQDVGQRDLNDALELSNLTPQSHALGYVVLFDVDGEIERTGLLGTQAVSLLNQVVGRILKWLDTHNWDYVTFIGGRRSRNKLYSALSRMLAQHSGGKVYFDFDTSDFVVYKPSAMTQQRVHEAFDYTLPRDKWRIIGSGDNYITFEFDIDGNIYTLELMEIKSAQKGIYDVYFSHQEHGLDISGTGSAFKVFSAVLQLLLWVINNQKQYNVKGIYFSAREPSRRKLYNKIAPQLARHLGWKFTTDASKMPYGASNKESGYLLLDPTISEAGGVGTVVKGVNTTADVGPDAVQKQARKFLNKVSRTGVPPQIQSNGKFVAPK